MIHSLLEAPPVQELTSSLSLNLSGTKVSGQLRMRRGRSIQISASMLGLVEVARIEFLPEMVVIMDKFHNLYSGMAVQSSCRLIRQDNLGIINQSSRNGHPLLLPTGQLSRFKMNTFF